MTELREILKKIEIFSSLDETSLIHLADQMKPVNLKDGEVVCNEGEAGSSMYLLDSGELSVMKKGKDGTPVEIAKLEPGEVAGIMSIFGGETRSATLKARGIVKLWEIQHRDFHKLLDDHPSISHHMLGVLSRYLREETRIVAELRTRDVDNRMKIAVFDSKPYTEESFIEKNAERYALRFFESRLNHDTIALSEGFKVVCAFVNDSLDRSVLEKLHKNGIEMIAMRCAGFNNLDLVACKELGISVANVPAYSPHAVAEHAIALMLTLNRHLIRAHTRVREGNFSLTGLVGFDMFGKTVGVVGAGKIGQCVIDILIGFGCNVLVHESKPKTYASPKIKSVSKDELLAGSDIITLHAPLFPETRHFVNAESIAKMKKGVMIINTSRGGLVDAQALMDGLISGHVGSAGLDVYEEEKDYFFEDLSDVIMTDETLARLCTFHNVIVTGHMAFLTKEALLSIADVTLGNIMEFESGKRFADLTNKLLPAG